MTRKDELRALADRVEALTEPDRQIDCKIENALGLAVFDRDPRIIYGDADYSRREPKPFTASLDAAMTLVPEGWDHMEVYSPDHQTLVWTAYFLPNGNLANRWTGHGSGQTYALAICAAALRALASQEPNT